MRQQRTSRCERIGDGHEEKALVIGGIAVTAALVGGWALAQTVRSGPGGFGPPFMHGQGADGMGPGMMQHMGMGMGHGMMNGTE